MDNTILQYIAMSAEADLKAIGAEEISHIITFKKYVVDITVTKLIEDTDNGAENT